MHQERSITHLTWLPDLRQDLLYAFRTLRRSPGFLACAVLTLGLGIVANAVIFSLVNGVLLRPPPFPNPDRLVAVLDSRPSQGIDWVFDSASRFEEWQRRNTVFDRIAGARNCYYRIESEGVPQLFQGGCASASFFPMLGVEPILGRLFSEEDDRPGAPQVVLLSFACWKRYFGGSTSVLGRTLRRTANDSEATIIGVLPPGFKFATDDFALWAPLRSDPNYRNRDERSLLVFARLKPGVALPQAQFAMDAVARQLGIEFPASGAGWSITLRPLQLFYSSVRNIRLTLWVLFASVGVLLLIACANLANLLLTRVNLRGREISIRLAVGASSTRVIRQLVTESLLLGILGGAAGFALARLTFRYLMTITPYIPSFRPDAIRVDTPVFLFSTLLAMLAALVFGLAPAVRASRQDLNRTLREAGRSVHGGRRAHATLTWIVASEISLAVVVLAAAGLLAQSFRNLTSESLGFNPSRVLTARLCCLDEANYPAVKDSAAFYRQLFDRLRAVPGVESASGASDLPLRGFQGAGSAYEVRGQPTVRTREERSADFFFIEPRYFDTLRIPILRGRGFNDLDSLATAPVAVVNESFARRTWPGEDPLGREVRMLDEPAAPWFHVVGVAADTRDRGRGIDPHPAIYASYYQSLGRYVFLVIRTRPDPMSLAPAIRSAFASLNGRMPLDRVAPLDQQIAESIGAQRFATVLSGLFAALALSLGAVGVYGVTACAVSQRTHEIGIRMALGASRGAVLGVFLREAARFASAGLTAGVLASLALTRFLENLLYGIHADDPLIFTAALILLAILTGLACLLPALRAMRVEPVIALRCE